MYRTFIGSIGFIGIPVLVRLKLFIHMKKSQLLGTVPVSLIVWPQLGVTLFWRLCVLKKFR